MAKYDSIFDDLRASGQFSQEWIATCKELEREVHESAKEDQIISPETEEAFNKFLLKETEKEREVANFRERNSTTFVGNSRLRRMGIYKKKDTSDSIVRVLDRVSVDIQGAYRDFHHYYNTLSNDSQPPMVYHFCKAAYTLGYKPYAIWIMCRALIKLRKLPIQFRYKDLMMYINSDWIRNREQYKKEFEEMKVALFADQYEERHAVESSYIRILIEAVAKLTEKLKNIDPVEEIKEFNSISSQIDKLKVKIDSVHGVDKMRDAMVEVAAAQAKSGVAENFKKLGITGGTLATSVLEAKINSDAGVVSLKSGDTVLDVDLASDTVDFDSAQNKTEGQATLEIT